MGDGEGPSEREVELGGAWGSFGVLVSCSKWRRLGRGSQRTKNDEGERVGLSWEEGETRVLLRFNQEIEVGETLKGH